MTTDTRQWDETKTRLRQRWPGLPDQDIEATEGDRAALLALLQARLGYARPNAEQDLDEILGGAEVVPEDVADEQTHTGTSGPVGPVSEATDYTGGSRREVPDRPGSGTSQQPSNRSNVSRGAGGGTEPARAAEGSSGPGVDREPPELPNQPPEMSSLGGGAAVGAIPGQGAGGTGGRPPVGEGRWGQDPFGSTPEGHAGGMPLTKVAFGVAGAGVTALAVGMMMRRKRKHRSKTEEVADQAKRLLSDISEKMPTVEEVRAKVMAIDELRSKEMKGKRFAALKRA